MVSTTNDAGAGEKVAAKTSAGLGAEKVTMGPIDKAFWFFEREEHPMTIGNIWEVDREISLEETIVQLTPMVTAEPYRRYRQLGVDDHTWGQVHWVDDPSFDIHHHVFAHRLPSPGTKAQARELISQLFSGPLDRSRPLWACDVITGLETGGTMIIFRLHHALTDGQGSIRALLSVTHSPEDRESLQYNAAKGKPAADGAAGAKKKHTAQDKAKKMFKKMLLLPVALLVLLYQLCILAVLGVKFLFRPKTSFYRDPSKMNRAKSLGWSRGIELEKIKFVKNAFGATVNDVIVGCVSGALRAHLVENKQPVQELLCGIPVSMRHPDDWDMKNESTMIYTFLPALESDPIKRIRAVNSRMNVLKTSPAPFLNHYTMKALYSIPFIGDVVTLFDRKPLNWIASRCPCVLTNVPGPQVALTFAGEKIKTYVPFIPQHGAGALGMGVVSYNGNVAFGIVTEDEYLQGGAQDVADRFEEAFNEVYMLALKKVAQEKMDKLKTE